MSPQPEPELAELDPFDLPEWLGVGEVTWSSSRGLRTGHLVPGELEAPGHTFGCDLLAVDQAFPTPVTTDVVRSLAHRAWRNGQVHLASSAERLVLCVPGTSWDPPLVMETLGRLAKAVGASPEGWSVRLRIGEKR